MAVWILAGSHGLVVSGGGFGRPDGGRVLLGTGWDFDARQRTEEELSRSGLSPEDQAAVRRTLAR